MSTRTIVVVPEANAGGHRLLSFFDRPQEAERFIEGLLEKGFDRRRILVLNMMVNSL